MRAAFVVAMAMACCAADTATTHARATGAGPLRGITFGTPPYSTPGIAVGDRQAQRSLEALAATGATAVRLLPTYYAPSALNGSVLYMLPVNTSGGFGSTSLSDLGAVAAAAKALGLRVLASPSILPDLTNPTACRGPSHSCPDRTGYEGTIGCACAGATGCTSPWTGEEWDVFFAALEKTLHAVVAALPGMDALELPALDCAVLHGGAARWAGLVQAVRAKLPKDTQLLAGLGLVAQVWALRAGPHQAAWLSDVDGLGLHAVYPLPTPFVNASVADLRTAWAGPLALISNLTTTFKSEVVLTRVGYQSRTGTQDSPTGVMTQDPTDESCWMQQVDLAIQANAYQAAADVLPSTTGLFWWLWPHDDSHGGRADDTFSPRGKPAEAVVRQLFGASKPAVPVQVAASIPLATQIRFPPGYGPAAAAKKFNGMCFGSGGWSTPNTTMAASLESLASLRQLGANSVRVLVNWYFTEHTVYRGNATSPLRTISDDDLRHLITTAQTQHGMEVQIAPYIDPDWANCQPIGPYSPKRYPTEHCPCRGPSCGNIPGTTPKTGRGNVCVGCTAEQWDTFFVSYTAFILHYARLAESLKVAQLCIGAELVGPFAQAKYWPILAAQVRQVYSGKLTAAINVGQAVKPPYLPWLGSLDFIGVEGYFSLPTPGIKVPTVDDLVQAWAEPVEELKALSLHANRSIMFTEVGYQARNHTSAHPASTNATDPTDFSLWGMSVSLTAQARAYEALLEALYRHDWFLGVNWWMWRSDPTSGGTADGGFSPHGKPAQEVLRHWYSGH